MGLLLVVAPYIAGVQLTDLVVLYLSTLGYNLKPFDLYFTVILTWSTG